MLDVRPSENVTLCGFVNCEPSFILSFADLYIKNLQICDLRTGGTPKKVEDLR
jgi:hypothetical protein